MINIFTKERHIPKISKFLKSKKIEFKIYTTKDSTRSLNQFELGISYCYPKKIMNPFLSIPSKGFVNYHPGPLPKYKGPNEFENAIRNKETEWGVTVHYMDENYDSGKIIKIQKFSLHEPPTSVNEIGALSHYFLFNLFNDIIN